MSNKILHNIIMMIMLGKPKPKSFVHRSDIWLVSSWGHFPLNTEYKGVRTKLNAHMNKGHKETMRKVVLK